MKGSGLSASVPTQASLVAAEIDHATTVERMGDAAHPKTKSNVGRAADIESKE